MGSHTFFFSAGLIIASVIWVMGLSFVINEARIQVASGEYKCILVHAKDKTTHWECKLNREGE